MKGRTVTHSDMFAALEHQERTAHFPAPSDYPAALALWREIIVRYDSAMRSGDTAAALAAAEEAELLIGHVYVERTPEEHRARWARPDKGEGEVWCWNDLQKRFAGDSAAADGETPMWGQAGRFIVENVFGVSVGVEIDGLAGLFSGQSLLPHFSIHIVEKHRMFLSETGYRSFFVGVGEAPKTQLAFAVKMLLCDYVEHEMKGKLVRYVSPEERKAEDAARRAKWAAGEAAPVVEDEDAEDEDEILSCECGAILAQLDHHFILPCGVMCPQCATAHVGVCAECAEDWEEPEVAYNVDGGADLLPGMGDVAGGRAEALAEVEGLTLAESLRTPLPSISKRTGTLEVHSPLFCNSPANPQLSLFGGGL